MRAGSKIDSARDSFEIDRGALVGQLEALLLVIRNAATEIAMVGAEGVFDKRLSAQLKRKAGILNREARKLEAIGAAIARAKFPSKKRSPNRVRSRR
jgi:hypothetical protein